MTTEPSPLPRVVVTGAAGIVGRAVRAGLERDHVVVPVDRRRRGTDVRVMGSTGLGWGFTGMGGYAVAIDTFQNTGEPAVPNVNLVSSAGTRIATAAHSAV